MNKRRNCADINRVPNDCILDIISRTSPRDAYNFALTSTSFKSVMDSDFLWQSFLPSDYATILSRVVEPLVYTSKKDLVSKLSERHVLIDGGTMSFGLDKSNGAKCYMASMSLLKITFAEETPFHWWKIPLPDSRFGTVIEPIGGCSMSIMGKINMNTLSQKIRYGIYLVYKLTKLDILAALMVREYGQQSSASVCGNLNEWSVTCEVCETGKDRGNGWIEMQIGEFYNDNGGDSNVLVIEKEIDSHHYHGGIILEGIEIRPKH